MFQFVELYGNVIDCTIRNKRINVNDNESLRDRNLPMARTSNCQLQLNISQSLVSFGKNEFNWCSLQKCRDSFLDFVATWSCCSVL